MFRKVNSNEYAWIGCLMIALVAGTLLITAVTTFAQDHGLVETAYSRINVLQQSKPTAALGSVTWDGGGATNNWSEAANWSGDLIPGLNDPVIFNATSTKNAVIDISIETSNLTVTAAYTGTISMAAGVNATFNDDFPNPSLVAGGTFNAGSGTLIFGNSGFGLTVSGGTFNGGSGPIIVRGFLNQSGGVFNGGSGPLNVRPNLTGGTFNAPSGTMTISGESSNLSAATFNHNGGTVTFTGGNANINLPGTIVFNNLTINKNEFGVVNFLDANRTIRVVGSLSLVEGRLSAPGSSPIKAEGPISIASTFGFPDSSVGGSATILIKDGTGARSIGWPSSAAIPNITLDDADVTLTVSGAGLAMSGAVHVLNGAFDAGSANLELGYGASTGHGYLQGGGTFHIGSGNFNLVTGGFQLSGGTFTMVSGNATLPCFLSVTISGGTFNASSGTSTMCPGGDFNGNFAHSGGTFNGGTGTLDINHRFTLSGSAVFNATSGETRVGFVFDHQGGTFNHNNGTVVFDSIHGSPFLNVPGNPGTGSFHHVIVSKNGGLYLNGDTYIVNGNLQLVNGAVSPNDGGGDTGTFDVRGNVTVEGGADGGNARISFSGSGAQTFTNSGGSNTATTWTVNKPLGTSVTAATSMTLGTSQPLNITSGTLYLASGSNLTAGALTIGTNGLLVNDSATTITLGAAAVNNGQLDLQGGGATCPETDSILLRSSVDGTRRNWSGSGVFRLVDVDVKDMGGSSATTPAITVFNGTNTSNNGTNWTFNSACPSDLTLSPLVANVTTGGTQQFNAAGGFAPRTFSIATNNSGGSINQNTGLYTAGATGNVSDTVRVTDGFGATADATVNVTGIATRLSFVVHPANATAGQSISPSIQVAVQDQFGNTVGTAVNSITLAMFDNPGAGTLSGTLTRNAVSGIATFDNISIDRSSSGYTLRATSGSLTAATSNPFNISAGAPTQLVFLTQPSNTEALQIMSPSIQVELRDSFGNRVTDDPRTIILSGGRLAGTLTQQTVAGIATFGGLTSNNPGNALTVRASSTNLPGVYSVPYDIIRPIFFVTHGGDNGAGSLRTGIESAGQILGVDKIHFNIPGAGAHSIIPTAALPRISEIEIDGTTQPGYAGVPIIEINGSQLPPPTFPHDGILTLLDHSTVRGLVINRFQNAIDIWGRQNKVKGNYLGTDLSGSIGLPGALHLTGMADSNEIGGSGSGDRNVLAKGIRSLPEDGSCLNFFGHNTIRGNYIGTNASGTAGLGDGVGILLSSRGNLIGGTGPGEGNLISGNVTAMIIQCKDNVVLGNLIGTDATGQAPLPNQNQQGIVIDGWENVIGGVEPGAGNTIAYNTFGVKVIPHWIVPHRDRNPIRGNTIHSNTGIAIRLSIVYGDGSVRHNDVSDLDNGANQGQNYPVLTRVLTSAASASVRGTLSSAPVRTYTLDFYSNPTCDPTGHGEGKTYVGTGTTSTDAGGIDDFDVIIPPVPIGHFLTATATDSFGNTSEFSNCRDIVPTVATISGRVLDHNNIPLTNTTVRLRTAGSDLEIDTVTNSAGEYTFRDMPTGRSYSVHPVRVNYAFTPSSRSYPALSADQFDQDYIAARTRFKISGHLATQLRGGQSLPISSVRLVLSGAVARVVIANGVYSFNDLPAGTYTLTPIKNGYEFSPPSVKLVISNADRTASFLGAADTTPPGRILFVNGGSIDNIDADGSGWGGLTDAWHSTDVSLSRDGKKVAYTKRTPSGGKSLYIADADGAHPVELIAGNSTTDNLQPEWSPDGARIAFVQVSAGRRAIRIRTVNGNLVSVPTTGLTNQSSPTWISANRLAFSAGSSTTGGATDIYALNTDGTNRIRLTFGSGQNHVATVPSASPDGTKIAYRSRTTGLAGGDLTILNLGTGDGTTIRSDAVSTKPSWSPDGTRLAYHQALIGDGLLKIATVNASNGTGLRVLFEGGVLGSPTWGPTYTFPTPAGSNVNTIGGGVRVAFSSVAASGDTTFAPTASVSMETAPNFAFSGRAYGISTTAAYVAPVSVCVTASSGLTQSGFDHIALLHMEGGVWVNRRTNGTYSTRQVCGEVTTLGIFALAHSPTPQPSGVGATFASIRGVVADAAGQGLPNVRVELSGTENHITHTDESGIFYFLNLTQGGNYFVEPRAVGFSFSDSNHTFTNLNGEGTAGFLGAPARFSISGRVTNLDNSPVAGIGVSLEGETSDYVLTDVDGNYAFTDLPADAAFVITPTGSGFFSPGIIQIGSLAGNVIDANFVHDADAPQFVSIGGRVMSSDGEGIRLASLSLIGPEGDVQTALSNPFGYYSFPSVRPGAGYILEIRKKGRAFTDSPFTIYVTEDLDNMNFIADP